MVVDKHGVLTFEVVIVALWIFKLLNGILSTQVHITYYFKTISLSKYIYIHVYYFLRATADIASKKLLLSSYNVW